MKGIFDKIKGYLPSISSIILVLLAIILFKGISRAVDIFFPKSKKELNVFSINANRKQELNEKDSKGIVQVPVVISKKIDKTLVPEGLKEKEVESVTKMKINSIEATGNNIDEYDKVVYYTIEIKN